MHRVCCTDFMWEKPYKMVKILYGNLPNLPLTDWFFWTRHFWTPIFWFSLDPKNMSIPITLNQISLFDLVLPQGVPKKHKTLPKSNQVFRRIFETSLEVQSSSLGGFSSTFAFLSRWASRAVQWPRELMLTNCPKAQIWKNHVFIGLQVCYWKMPQNTETHLRKQNIDHTYTIVIDRKSELRKTSESQHFSKNTTTNNTSGNWQRKQRKLKKCVFDR